MPTVEFSPDQLSIMANGGSENTGIFFNPGNTGGNSPSESFLGCTVARLALFSGTIPAQPRLMSASDFANTLAYWTLNSEYTTFNKTATTTLTTTFKAATATGTATWFSWCWYNATPPATSGTIQQRIIGTVGTIGSGADLEMLTTSIVSGQQYRVYNLRIALPSTYTY